MQTCLNAASERIKPFGCGCQLQARLELPLWGRLTVSSRLDRQQSLLHGKNGRGLETRRSAQIGNEEYCLNREFLLESVVVHAKGSSPSDPQEARHVPSLSLSTMKISMPEL